MNYEYVGDTRQQMTDCFRFALGHQFWLVFFKNLFICTSPNLLISAAHFCMPASWHTFSVSSHPVQAFVCKHLYISYKGNRRTKECEKTNVAAKLSNIFWPKTIAIYANAFHFMVIFHFLFQRVYNASSNKSVLYVSLCECACLHRNKGMLYFGL